VEKLHVGYFQMNSIEKTAYK